jgi:excisionase family DNA binding protein
LNNLINNNEMEKQLGAVLTEGMYLLTPEAIKELTREVVRETLAVLQASRGPEKAEEGGLLTCEEAIEILHVNRSTLWRWAKEGYLPHYKAGQRVLYRREDIDKMIGFSTKK